MGHPAFLFDLDGVIVDTEGQYTLFWDSIGETYLGETGLSAKIKGEPIEKTLRRYFPEDRRTRDEVREKLLAFEHDMDYGYIPGAYGFITGLKRKDYAAAIVTSSNRGKMENVYRSHPEIRDIIGHILTCDDFTRPKPYPDCYLLGMEVCGTAPEDTYIFEDSFNGLRSAKDSGGNVIALATTNSRESVSEYSGMVIDDFTGMTPEAIIGFFHPDSRS